jgi:adenine-specific DNA-methyltransferase
MSDQDFQDFYETPSGTPDFKTVLAAQLSELVPEAIADGKVDVEKLKELLGEDVGDERERFGLFWPGKKRALRAAQEPTTATLKPDFENSKDWDTTKNVFIEGDNLEVLKILQKHYHGKIKMIYIDPPYNTGKDFVYPDNYKEGLATYLEWTRQVNEEGKKISTNSESEGRYHSNWLNMMYPRLKLARNLLTQDGVMLISIDDHEQENLKRVGDEVFGETNVEVLVWNKEAEGSSGTLKAVSTFRRVHEYVIACHRNIAEVQWTKVREALEGREDELQTANLAVNASNERVGHENYFSITNLSGDVFTRQWKWGKEEIDRLISEDLLYWGSDGRKQPRLIIPTDGRRTTFLRSILNYGGTTAGRKDFEAVMGTEVEFSYPKPLLLLKKLILSVTSDEDIVLDFFSGSGSTACAVLEANAEDGGFRRHIQVQLPEPVEEDSVAAAKGFRTIADISRSRISRAGDQIATSTTGQSVDVGYRAYTLTDTNFSKWRVTSEVAATALQQHILDLRDSADDDATADSLLIELLLKQGYSLTEQVGEAVIDGLNLKSVGDGLVLAYLDENTKPTLQQLRTVLDSPDLAKFIILEDAFKGDDELKTNLVQEAKSRNIELWTA